MMFIIVEFMTFLSILNLVEASVYYNGIIDMTNLPAFYEFGCTDYVPSNHSWFFGGTYGTFSEADSVTHATSDCSHCGSLMFLMVYSISFVVIVIISLIIGYFDIPCELVEPYLGVLDYIYYPLICLLILTEELTIWVYQKANPPPPRRQRNFSIYDDPPF